MWSPASPRFCVASGAETDASGVGLCVERRASCSRKRHHRRPDQSAVRRSKEVFGKEANNVALLSERFTKPCFTPAGAKTVSPGPSVTTSSPSTASSVPSTMTIASSVSGWIWVVTVGTRFDLKMPHPEGFGTVAGIHQDGPGDTWITLFRLGVGSVQDRHQFISFIGNISAITGLHGKLGF